MHQRQEQNEKAAAREINAYKAQAQPRASKRASETKAVKFSATHSTHPPVICEVAPGWDEAWGPVGCGTQMWASHLVQHNPLSEATETEDRGQRAASCITRSRMAACQAGFHYFFLASFFFFLF